MMDVKFLFHMKADSEASLIKMGELKPLSMKFCYGTFFWSCGMAGMNLQLSMKPKNVFRYYVRIENKKHIIRLKDALRRGKLTVFI